MHDDLIDFGDRFLSGGAHRILVPLCGKSVDMPWLANRGHEVVGIELVPQAVDAFFAEHGLDATESVRGGLRLLQAGTITLVNADIFSVTPRQIGSVDRIWDRAALVALPAKLREPYVQTLRGLAPRGSVLLQNTFEYDTGKMNGPPFSVPDAEFRAHYRGCRIELLQETDSVDLVPEFRQHGHEWFRVRTYLVTL